MEIQESFDVPIPRGLVYAEFGDVAAIGACIAGVQEVQVINDDESRWRVSLTAGFMAVTIDLEAKITERREPDEVKFVATAQNVDLSGAVVLTEAGGGTSCEITIDINPQGGLAPLMVQLGRGPQERLARETISNLREHLLESGPADAAAPGTPTPTLMAAPSRPPMPQLQLPIAAAAIAAGALVGLGFLAGRLGGPGLSR
jgi:carbon monoxide dehydrogenase subunit G